MNTIKLQLQPFQLPDLVQGGLGEAPEGGAGVAGLEDGADAEQHEPRQQAVVLAV